MNVQLIDAETGNHVSPCSPHHSYTMLPLEPLQAGACRGHAARW